MTGGDGTVHQRRSCITKTTGSLKAIRSDVTVMRERLWVANGLPLPAGQDGPLVGLLPAGTGNDLARALGLPPDPVAAARALLDGRPRPIDMLDCGPRRAANGINAGFAAAATDVLSRPVKRALGPAAYVVGGVWAGLRPPTWPARVEVEGRVVDGEALAVVVGNGGSFGGGRWLLPDADVGDGLLDVLVVPAAASRAKLARTLAMDRRLPDDLPRLRGPAATVVTGMPCRLDGEPAPTPGSVAVIPGAWRVLAPSSG